MRTMPSLSLLALVVSLVSCALPPARVASPGRPVSGSDRPPFSARDVERSVHASTNAARRRQGVPAVAFDDAFAAVARRHSADMARRGYFDHRSPDGADANARAARDHLSCRVEAGDRVSVGFMENLAQVWRYSRWRETSGPGGTRRTYEWRTLEGVVAETVDGWLQSPGHRRNLLLRQATREGVGVSIRDDGAVYVTQVLC